MTALVHERRNELYTRTTALHDLQIQLAGLAGMGGLCRRSSPMRWRGSPATPPRVAQPAGAGPPAFSSAPNPQPPPARR